MASLTPRPHSHSGRSVRLPNRELARLHEHAIAGFPNEVVGILAGDRSSDTIQRVVPLENTRATEAARRYHVDGLTLARAEMKLDAEGLEVVGYYHSHPDHPASWSDADRDQALPQMTYVIAAVHGPDGPQGQPGTPPRAVDTRAWRLREDRSAMDSETLVLTD